MSALLCLATVAAYALDPAKPPGRNFDLTHWHLTLPDADASTISPSQLVGGYTNADWFYTGPDGAMVCFAPVTGGSTANSVYPRSELRERIDPGDTGENWTLFGTHILDVQCRVTQLPSTAKVIIGQIHGYPNTANPLFKILYTNGIIDAQFKISPNASNDAHVFLPYVATNELITYRIKVVNGVVSTTINGQTRSMNAIEMDPEWTNLTFYFKAGSYCQDNVGTNIEGARVAIYSLALAHTNIAQSEPLITAHPVPQAVEAGNSILLSVASGGTAPLRYQWRKDEVDLPGETNELFSLASAQTNDTGNYTVMITNAYGSATSFTARLDVALPSPFISIGEALDVPNLTWVTNGSAWTGQAVVTYDSQDAARSGSISNNASTSVQTTVTGPGRVRFFWKVSSEPGNDRLLFFLNNTELARISGEVDWQEQSFDLPAGVQTLEWRYSKNGSLVRGQDRAWLDQVRFEFVPPAITLQPASQTVDASTTVTLSVAATGTPPLAYRWRWEGIDLVDGSNVRGANTATLTLSNVAVALSGNYSVVVSNPAGTLESSNAFLTINAVSNLAVALDANGLTWTTNGTPPWIGQEVTTHDGMDAARSGAVPHGQQTSFQTTVNGPGTVSFWWKVSSEPSNDRLLFFVGSSERARISGEVDWQWQTFSIGSGSQVLKWTYSKNNSVSAGQDRGWVDEMIYIPNNVPTAPIIAVQPASQSVDAMTTTTFSVGAIGSPTLTYRWQFNGTNLTNGGSISGATTATLTLSGAQAGQAGNYSVLLSNAAGTTVSSSALLTVLPNVPLADALDTSNLVWTISGPQPWIGQTSFSYDAASAARSGSIDDGDAISMQTTVYGPGTVGFWWKVSSETNNDRLVFYVAGTERARISGEVGWEYRAFTVSSNSQVLQWTYSKNSSVAAGLDRGWVDRVSFVPTPVPVAPRLVLTGHKAIVQWTSIPGRYYRVGFKYTLGDPQWIDLERFVPGTGGVITIGDALEGWASRYYRVIEE